MGRIPRRRILQSAAAASLLGIGGGAALAAEEVRGRKLVSPGCRGSKVKVARVFLGIPRAHYPNPAIDLEAEVRAYRAGFEEWESELADVEFTADGLLSSAADFAAVKEKLGSADGILVVHLTLGTLGLMREILGLGRPTVIFSPPYAGHEWYELSAIRRSDLGKRMECILSTGHRELVRALRSFRALHHFREARVLNVATWAAGAYGDEVKKTLGTEIRQVPRDRVLELYEAVPEAAAKAEAEAWTKGAVEVVEPSAEEIFKSAKLALAFERLLDVEGATVLTVDCYGSMWRQLPAYPCIGFARLSDMGFGGICQSDLPCALVHILFQGLSGRPGFVSNPTFDFANGLVTLIHCLAPRKMDGPDGPSAPYRLRSVMEREEGATPEVEMRPGRRATAAIFDGMKTIRYFTGEVVEAPRTDRGCRTKMAIRVVGDAEKLWRNWTAGIHRVACYGDLSKDLERFARFAGFELLNEAV